MSKRLRVLVITQMYLNNSKLFTVFGGTSDQFIREKAPVSLSDYAAIKKQTDGGKLNNIYAKRDEKLSGKERYFTEACAVANADS